MSVGTGADAQVPGKWTQNAKHVCSRKLRVPPARMAGASGDFNLCGADGPTLAYWSLAACLIIVIAIVLMKLAQLGVMSDLLGAFQRLALIAYFGWAFTIALNLNNARP